MLSLDLEHIFKARGIDKPYTFLVKAGFTPHSASVICNSKTRVIKLDHIELLCKALVCEPNDILSYKASKGEVLGTDHPLLKLKHQEIEQTWKESIATIPYNQLKELSKGFRKTE